MPPRRNVVSLQSIKISNMKKIIFTIFGFLFSFALSSCDEGKYIQRSEVKLMEPAGGIISTPLVAEIKNVSNQKIQDTIQFSLYSKHARTRLTGTNLLEYRKMALDQCITKHECDILILAKFQYILSEDGKNLSVIVTGYPAIYSNIRPATDNDSWMINFMGQGDNAYYIHTTLDTIKRPQNHQ